MSILIDKNTRLLVQGITGHEGLFHTAADDGLWNQCGRWGNPRAKAASGSWMARFRCLIR